MRWSVPVVLVSVCAMTACGGGDGGSDEFPYPLWVPTDVAVLDVDGDGRRDILTLAQLSSSASEREGRLVVHRQTAPGTYTATYTASFGVFPWRLAISDLDGDGAVDAAVTDPDGNSVWVLLQDPRDRGRFLPARQVATGLRSYSVAAADFDGDNLPDLAVSDNRMGSARLVLLYQDSAQRGTFRPPASLAVPGAATTAVAAGDLDGDGRADLAIGVALPHAGSTPRPAFGISLQQADGTLGPVTTYAPQDGLNVARLAIADYEGDGRNDLLAYLTPFSTSYVATLMVLPQGPVPGTFGAATLTRVGVRGIDDAVFADLDGDQRPDAALCGFFPVGSPSTVEARLNRYTQAGAGGFALVSSEDLAIAASRLTAGDLDGDGRNEIVVLAGEDRYRVLD